MSFSLITFMVTGLLFIGMSIPLIKRKIKINHWYGVRLPQTMKNESVWYTVNEIMGKYILVFGIIIFVLSIILFLIPLFTELMSVIILSIISMVGAIGMAMRSIKISNQIGKNN